MPLFQYICFSIKLGALKWAVLRPKVKEKFNEMHNPFLSANRGGNSAFAHSSDTSVPSSTGR